LARHEGFVEWGQGFFMNCDVIILHFQHRSLIFLFFVVIVVGCVGRVGVGDGDGDGVGDRLFCSPQVFHNIPVGFATAWLLALAWLAKVAGFLLGNSGVKGNRKADTCIANYQSIRKVLWT
jgi:hypothetical protein